MRRNSKAKGEDTRHVRATGTGTRLRSHDSKKDDPVPMDLDPAPQVAAASSNTLVAESEGQGQGNGGDIEYVEGVGGAGGQKRGTLRRLEAEKKLGPSETNSSNDSSTGEAGAKAVGDDERREFAL
ncbi:uncharacterized protein JCM6883_004147 [Sporobolomyces salmoneus]|uniref:uncharacterized protein n=1 Tax=Sporobolomyces salmoneus TaxID=183962 RepID=UPI003179D520